jgi:hypothetical protein
MGEFERRRVREEVAWKRRVKNLLGGYEKAQMGPGWSSVNPPIRRQD